jgi:DNA polymerase III delta prime subunit
MSIMSLPTLLIGGSSKSRKDEAINLAKGASSWDCHILDTRVTSGIHDVRGLTSELNKKPINSLFKIALILEAQNLTLEAQNALLKTLEEPPKNTKIVLTAATSEGLLSTISSRCLKINMALDSQNDHPKKLDKFLSLDSYEQWLAAADLDLESWLSFWRERLLGTVFSKKAKREKIAKISRYLKLIIKVKSLKKRNASSKILNSIVLFETPQEP